MKLHEHCFFPRDLGRDYPVAVRGEGVWIWDEEGRRYLDGCSGANVTGIGHGVMEIVQAMKEQAEQIAYVPPQHFLNRSALELSRKLIDMAPSGFSRVMFLSGGSEAVENALKIARQYHVLRGKSSKYRVVSRWRGFHGNTLAADAASGHTLRRRVYTPMLMDVPHIVHASCYRCPFGKEYPGCGLLCAGDLRRTIIQEDAEYISAFIAETIVGAAAAAVTPVQEYYPIIREICDRYDILWIADEVMTGVGRTGSFLAAEGWGVTPDMVVLAKGLSSGYAPLSAILIHERVFKVFEEAKSPFIGGHTYNAHPVTAATGLAVLKYIEKNRIIEGVQKKGLLMEQGLREIARKEPLIGEVRGRGLMWGLEFVIDRETRNPFDPGLDLALKVMLKAQERGLIIYPCVGLADGLKGDGCLICPPLTIKEDEIEILLRMLGDTLSEVRETAGVRS